MQLQIQSDKIRQINKSSLKLNAISDEKVPRVAGSCHKLDTSSSFHLHNTSLKHIMDKCYNNMQQPFLLLGYKIVQMTT